MQLTLADARKPDNRLLERRGKVFATRFHLRALATPRDVRNTLRYVLLNRKHHAPGASFDRYWVDPFSSGPWLTGWAEPIRRPDTRALAALPSPTRPARTWLLAVGWRRHGAIRFDERCAAANADAPSACGCAHAWPPAERDLLRVDLAATAGAGRRLLNDSSPRRSIHQLHRAELAAPNLECSGSKRRT